MNIDPNDKPILCSKDDRLGFDGLARAISNQIISNEQPDGTVYSIYGCWGAGKSSLVNLVREKLPLVDTKKEYKISEFMCWWLNDEEKLKSEFLDHLMSQLDSSVQEESIKLLQKLGHRFLHATKKEAVDFVNQSQGLAGSVGRVAVSVFLEENNESSKKYDSSDLLFRELYEKTSILPNKKNLIIIDDIDRLLPNQTLTLFNLIKTIGRLPNFSYLVAYDRQIVEKLISKKFPSEGPHFLEKIVQVGFEVPIPSSEILKDELLDQLTKLSDKFDYQKNYYFMKLFDHLVLPNILTLRDLIKLVSLVKNSWNIIGEYVNVADFLAIETLKLFQPNLFSKLRMHKLDLTEETIINTKGSFNEKFFETTQFAKTKDNIDIILNITEGLKILFPNLRLILDKPPKPGNHRIKSSEIKIRGAHASANFDMYFNLQIPNTLYKSDLTHNLIDQCSCLPKVNEIFELISDLEETHQHPLKIINFFGEVKNLAEKIDPDGFSVVLEGFFQNYSSLLKKYKQLNPEENRTQLHILIIKIFRVMFKSRIKEEEWSQLIYDHLVNSDLDCLIDFAIYSHSQFNKEQAEVPNEFFILKREHSKEISSLTTEKIEKMVDNNQIYLCENFSRILLGWDKLEGNQNYSNAQRFCAIKISDKNFVVKFAQSFVTVRDKFSNSLESGNVCHKLGSPILHYIRKDQLEILLNFKKLIDSANKLISDKSCASEEKTILETFLNAQIVTNNW